jgi:hypothetical protein
VIRNISGVAGQPNPEGPLGSPEITARPDNASGKLLETVLRGEGVVGSVETM